VADSTLPTHTGRPGSCGETVHPGLARNIIVELSSGVDEWEIELHAEVDAWLLGLCTDDPDTADLVEDAIDQLSQEGPTLGRPMVDRIKGSRHHKMKELRTGSKGNSEVRILFAFDLERHAILLVAGDKAGDWQGWYNRNIPIADRRFDEHLDQLAENDRRIER